MKRVERVTFTCQYAGCGKLFQIRITEVAKRQPKYCSNICLGLGSRTAEYMSLICQNKKCNKTFEAKLDHGRVPKYCCRACFLTSSAENTVEKICAQCQKPFTVRVSETQKTPRAGTCCSRECQRKYFVKEKHNAAQERLEKTCLNEACKKSFHVLKSIFYIQKYCSVACRKEHKKSHRDECVCLNPTCRKLFTAAQEHGKRRLYCSRECYFQHNEGKVLTRACAQCKKTFYILESEAKLGPRRGTCCSRTCASIFFKAENGVNWKGGIHQTETNGPGVFIKRKGRINSYIGQHRLIAEKAIGRELHRSEIVLRLDRNNNNNDPANLYICKDTTHAGKLLHGALTWPSKSNLDTYR